MFRLRGWTCSTAPLDQEGMEHAVDMKAADIREWLGENLTEWDLAATDIQSDSLAAHWSQIYFCIHDKADAAFFVLRWGGDERLEY